MPDRRIAATFDFSETLDLIGITSRMKITSTSVISADDALFVIAGTLSGHVFYASCAAGSLSATVDSSRAVRVFLSFLIPRPFQVGAGVVRNMFRDWFSCNTKMREFVQWECYS